MSCLGKVQFRRLGPKMCTSDTHIMYIFSINIINFIFFFIYAFLYQSTYFLSLFVLGVPTYLSASQQQLFTFDNPVVVADVNDGSACLFTHYLPFDLQPQGGGNAVDGCAFPLSKNYNLPPSMAKLVECYYHCSLTFS